MAAADAYISLGVILPKQLTALIEDSIKALGLSVPEQSGIIEKPAQSARGDLASPVAMQLVRGLNPEQRLKWRSPLLLAQAIVERMQQSLPSDLASQIESFGAVAPGFINIKYSQSVLIDEAAHLAQLSQLREQVESKNIGQNHQQRRTVIEYVSPNTNKPLHIGHLRNAAVGWSLSRLLLAGGDQVQKAIIFNDRGLHIMKSCWGYLAAGQQSSDWNEVLRQGDIAEAITTETKQVIIQQDWRVLLSQWQTAPHSWLQPEQMVLTRLQKSDHFIGYYYQLAELFATEEAVTSQWSAMLLCWEDATHPLHQQLRALWTTMNDWFYNGFERTRQRFGFGFDSDSVSYESQIYQKGKDLVIAAADQGKLERLPDGAIIARLEAAGLPDKILLRRDGTGIYMTFDIELTRQRTASNAQQLIWIVGVDQKLYFQQLFAVAQQLGYGRRERYFHLAYGMVRLPEGKMSSRKGTVLYADDILDLAVERAKAIMREAGSRDHLSDTEFDHVAEAVGVGAVKWTMLSVDALSEITFDVQNSVSFKGFAGPYIQYTHARCRSVLSKQNSNITISIDPLLSNLIDQKKQKLCPEEIDLLRNLFTYYEIIRSSAEMKAPHILCNYLYELCQSFNGFYGACPIITDTMLDPTLAQVRVTLTQATASVVAAGLDLLGIEAVERM